MRGCWLIGALLALPHTALAQDPPEDAATAVDLARAAFEFRDFKKVVEVLRPWVRPMRIQEEALKINARSLLGVSLHLLGEVDAAKEEFGDLLLLDPKHDLDPFAVPPDVIATFEGVRRELRPTLDQILAERGEKPPEEPPVRLELVTVPHPATTLLPFGIPQFIMGEPGWGAAFATVQLLAVAGNVAAYFGARAFLDDGGSNADPGYTRLTGLQYGALAVALLAYAGSVINAYFLLDGIQADLQTQSP